MKCNAQIIYYEKLSKTGKRKKFTTLPKERIIDEFKEYMEANIRARMDWDNIGYCDGKIIANVDCHDEPNFGEEYSTYAELDVTFKCDTCGHTVYPLLPNQYSINDWLNKILDGME